MGLFKARTGDATTLPNPNFSHQEPVHSGTPIHAESEEGPQKWPDDNRSYCESSHKPASPARSPRPSTTESALSPRQQHGPYLSPGLDATSAAGRLRQFDQSGYSRSTNHISLEPRIATTKPLEGRSYKQYHIPIPREVPSPASLPKQMATSSSLAPPFPSAGDPTALIGMALGSPSHPPGSADAPWHIQTLTTVSSGGDATEPAANPNGLSRSMSKRWNPFSRTKSKRSKPADGSLSRAVDTDSKKSFDVGSRVHLVKHADPLGSHKGSSVSLLKEPVPTVHVLPEPREAAVPTREAPAPPQLQSLLSIEIPTVEMERYSIMFGSILQKQQPLFPQFLQQSSLPPVQQEPQEPQEPQLLAPKAQYPEPPQRPAPVPKPQQSRQKESESPLEQSQRPSLPDRRQVKVDKLNLPALKQYRDGSVPYEIVVPRRSTSPLPANSSSVPDSTPDQAPPPANSNLPPRVSSRARSNTTTAVANFPNPAMNKPQSQTRKRTSSVSTPSRAEPLPADAEPMPERRERLISKFHRKESLSEPVNHKVTQSSESLVPAPTNTPPQPRSILKKPTAPPPPPPSNRSAEHIAPPKQHKSKPSEASTRSEIDEEVVEKALYEAVEISIARQISVSRQQRKLLVPLDRSASRRAAGSPDAAARINLGKNKRLIETKTVVPVLVHPDGETNFPHGGSRKSSRVVLERA
ncbi:hypothetical protein BBK36DRAFT_1175712 [Trichoderma citrinoviride]|uniref:Uncharacterized protein n=1 Tax=Trichoderma citrinoviride TaxID=58853 RepID=A0A2T4BND1_9HYPO|nr:hypothetical protein BBK36DRAFT_1175712 [Trichoderma citrinoviride]PTB70834.1 hypothetical protein BBK36DRAFT_1175712 [Trichoderma citrinoviride]